MLIERFSGNPVLEPNKEQSWQAEAVFNGCPVKTDKKVYLLYRAMSQLHYHAAADTRMMLSEIGLADSKDGIHFKNHKRFITAEDEWDKFGCEDPRVTKFNNKYFIFYTALSNYPFNAEGIKVGVAISKDLKKVDEKHLVTPFNAKGMILFPEKINGKLWGMLTVNTDKPPSKICLRSFNSEEEIWDHEKWMEWYNFFDLHSLNLVRRSEDHVEVGSQPIKTKYGWLIFYSYMQNYYTPPALFTIEAVLLDLNNPFEIVARTELPLLSPGEYYEQIGFVPNVVFPSGAYVKNDKVHLYYGAADTSCCLATGSLTELIGNMSEKEKSCIKLVRSIENPILQPIKEHAWESRAVFNPAAITLNNKIHIVYRAMSEDNTSTMGYAVTSDGIHMDYRSPEPIYVPREDFEAKNVPGGNSGCEDPRITRIGNNIYMFYTAYNGTSLPRVAMTHITVNDFLAQKWNWEKPVVISAPNLDDKDALIFPQKFFGDYMIVHRNFEDIDLAFVKSLDFKPNQWLDEYRWIPPRKGWWDSKKVGAAAPPIKTEDGWIMLYHGVSDDGIYRVGAVLLSLKNPVNILGRTDNPIFEPEKYYEKEGQVKNVVFPCGVVSLKDRLYVYYGGGDSVIGLATVETKKLLKVLKTNGC